jgi:hypothetical protein
MSKGVKEQREYALLLFNERSKEFPGGEREVMSSSVLDLGLSQPHHLPFALVLDWE